MVTARSIHIIVVNNIYYCYTIRYFNVYMINNINNIYIYILNVFIITYCVHIIIVCELTKL